MGLAINTNVTSMKSQRHLGKNTDALNKSFERLSSGLRINNASDDAAGMNITTKLTSQVKGLNQAGRNVSDAGSLLKTAESALSETNNLLQRLRELAVQAGNDTNTSADRQALQSETTQLLSEINRVANQVQYNGQLLLDGSFSSKSFQVGANAGQILTVSIAASRSTDIGNANTVKSSESGVGTVKSGNNRSTGAVVGTALLGGEVEVAANGVIVGVGATAVADDTFSFDQQERSAIAKANAVNKVAGQTGVTAEATASSWISGTLNADGTGVINGAVYTDGDIIVNGVSITVEGGSTTIAAADGDSKLQDAINAKSAQTGVVASLSVAADGDATDGGLVLTATDGRNITVALTGAGETIVDNDAGEATAGTGLGTVTRAFGGITFSSNDTSQDFQVQDAAGNINLIGLITPNQTSSTDTTEDIASITLSSQADAKTAMDRLDTAIAQVAASRSALGALLNRLDSASNTLKISSENMSAARSSIQDVDFAQETAEFSKNQILQQASASMLAQANTSGQIALTLLGFG